jgi:hypothetical protein
MLCISMELQRYKVSFTTNPIEQEAADQPEPLASIAENNLSELVSKVESDN